MYFIYYNNVLFKYSELLQPVLMKTNALADGLIQKTVCIKKNIYIYISVLDEISSITERKEEYFDR